MKQMGTEKQETLTKFLEAQTDWYTTCPVCGTKRSGTLAELRKACTHGK